MYIYNLWLHWRRWGSKNGAQHVIVFKNMRIFEHILKSYAYMHVYVYPATSLTPLLLWRRPTNYVCMDNHTYIDAYLWITYICTCVYISCDFNGAIGALKIAHKPEVCGWSYTYLYYISHTCVHVYVHPVISLALLGLWRRSTNYVCVDDHMHINTVVNYVHMYMCIYICCDSTGAVGPLKTVHKLSVWMIIHIFIYIYMNRTHICMCIYILWIS